MSQADLLVPGAVLDDVPGLSRLSAVLGYPATDEQTRCRLSRSLARPDEVIVVAEVLGSGILGWVHAAEQGTLESDPHCEIVGLVVDANHRRHGVGRRLIDEVESWARRRGLRMVGVRSNVTRAESHPFYEQLGYVRAKTSHVYRKTLSST